MSAITEIRSFVYLDNFPWKTLGIGTIAGLAIATFFFLRQRTSYRTSHIKLIFENREVVWIPSSSKGKLGEEFPYFNRLFFSKFKEANASEIPLLQIKKEVFLSLRGEPVPIPKKIPEKLRFFVDQFKLANYLGKPNALDYLNAFYKEAIASIELTMIHFSCATSLCRELVAVETPYSETIQHHVQNFLLSTMQKSYRNRDKLREVLQNFPYTPASFSLKGFYLTLHQLQVVLKVFPDLEGLELELDHDWNVGELLSKFKKLSSLTLHWFGKFNRIPTVLDQIKGLVLAEFNVYWDPYSGLTDEGSLDDHDLDVHFSNKTQLTGLHLYRCHGVTHKGLEILGKLCQLTELEIHEANSDRGLKPLISLENLKVLRLCNCKWIKDDDLSVLCSLKKVETLDLSGSSITDRGLAYLKELPALREVNLFECSHVTPNGIAQLKLGKNLVVSK